MIDDFSNIPLDFIADDDARSNNAYSSITSFIDGASSNPPPTTGTNDASVFVNSGHCLCKTLPNICNRNSVDFFAYPNNTLSNSRWKVSMITKRRIHHCHYS